MSSDRDPVKPTPFEAVAPAPAAQAQTSTTQANHRGVLFALLALLVLAALVVLWLPGQVKKNDEASEQVARPATPTAPTPRPAQTVPPAPQVKTPSEAAATPFAQATEDRQRQAAQEVLTPMLDLQYALREQGVERWAPVPFASAGELAVTGDTLYRDRQFEPAQEKYQAALDALQELQSTVPDVLADHLERARRAIEQGDSPAATELLEIAALIAPGDMQLTTLEQRLAQVPAIAELLDKAGEAEREDNLERAAAALQQAAALDSEHLKVAAELQRVTTALRRKNFNQAMSDGYAALSAQQFSQARKHFRQANSLSPGSDEAASALHEVGERETAYRLQQLARRGEQAQSKEDWTAAVTIYEQALALDSTVLFATQGLARARPRAQLADQLQTLLDDPQRLEDEKVVKAARQLLAQGKAESGEAPVLEAQLAQLDELVTKATTPVTIVLRSDQLTEVIVHRVARLGRFEQHSLALRPGHYTAVGSRRGYRDVRQNFTVSHDAATGEISIVCTEPI